jgi:hypothetical protein
MMGRGARMLGRRRSPDKVRRERIDDTKHKLRQLQQRWDNRLILEKESFFEAYLDGRLCVGLVVDIGGRAFGNGTSVTEDANTMGREWTCGVLLYKFNPGLKRVTGEDDGSMLIDVVQSVECPKGKVPSLVRLYRIDDKLAKVGADLLFKSAIDGLYKFFPRFMHGEVDLTSTGVATQVADDLSYGVVERAPEIVNGITDDHTKPVDSECAWGPKIKAQITRFRVFIDERSVTLVHQEAIDPSLRISDVLIGPFNL